MSNATTQTPVVLCFSGHDPSGGAGVQADIEAIAAQGGHAATVITALTVQDTNNVECFSPVDPDLLKQQAEKILLDMPVLAIKIGMTGAVATVHAINDIITRHPDIPVILDPVLAAGGGASLTGEREALVEAIQHYLLPHCTLVTPNIPEALGLTGCDNAEDAAQSLIQLGAKTVLITGTHEESDAITHRLLTTDENILFTNPRLPGEYHGSGCTLASATAALIARGKAVTDAVRAGLDYTFRSLQQARAVGKGQQIPLRHIEAEAPFGSAVRLITPGVADERLKGLYAITDEQLIGLYFEAAVEQALKGGARIIQYRNKSTNERRRQQQAETLRRLCDQYNGLLIINDDVDLALAVNADGVHIGREDLAFEQAREKLGPDRIIGVSCYNDIELARQAEQKGADYVAFGAFFSSNIKPEAASAELQMLEQACNELSVPVCCIGGITSDNASPLVDAGSDMLAVISDLFAQSPEEDGIQQAAERLSRLFSA